MTLPTPESHAPATVRSKLAWLTLAAIIATYLLSVLTTTAGDAVVPPPPDARSPIGAIQSLQAGSHATLRAVGWASDPDRPAAHLAVYGIVDGKIAGRTRTWIPRPRIHADKHVPLGVGFNVEVPIGRPGTHTVCIGVQNVGTGLSPVLGCTQATITKTAGLTVTTHYNPHRSASYNARYNTMSTTQLSVRLATQLTAEPKAEEQHAHDPHGTVQVAASGTDSVQLTGWAVDPDFRDRRVIGAVGVDGTRVTTFVTKVSDTDQRTAGAGRLGAFDLEVPVTSGSHRVCLSLGNVGFGQPVQLQCAHVYVSPVIASIPVNATGVNGAVVKEALTHLGQKYVWATQGPTTFDCSGLVWYSFQHAGVSVPRIAADQAAAATPIPASDARPGDLVFYHDKKGHVYHVGIYLAPGESVAAIDPAEGVDYQPITDPTATYGSFTHS